MIYARTIVLLLVSYAILPTTTAQESVINQESARAAVHIQAGDRIGSGALVVLHNKALVLTSRQAVENSNEAQVSVLVGNTQIAQPMFRAELRGFSMEQDFAFLELTHELGTTPAGTGTAALNPFSIQKLRAGEYGFNLPGIILNPFAELTPDTVITLLGYRAADERAISEYSGTITSLTHGELTGIRVPQEYFVNSGFPSDIRGGLALDAQGNFVGIVTELPQQNQTNAPSETLISFPFMLALMSNEEKLTTDWSIYRQAHGIALNATADALFANDTLSSQDIDLGYAVAVRSAALTNANSLSQACDGFVAITPDLSITTERQLVNLKFAFQPQVGSDSDPLIVIQSPDGAWHCQGESNNVEPEVTFEQAIAGEYNVWLGTLNSEEVAQGQLVVSRAHNGGIPTAVNTKAATSVASDLNPSAEPLVETVQLSPGFSPSPHSITFSSVGSIDMSTQNIPECEMFVSEAPQVTLKWDGSGSNLVFTHEAFEADAGTTLVINDANGNWLCHSGYYGSFGELATLTIENAPAGQYQIWVGHLSNSYRLGGMLKIEE